jgi:hypothetical protein
MSRQEVIKQPYKRLPRTLKLSRPAPEVNEDCSDAHAKRVCSERFRALLARIGAFGAQINQPVVAQIESPCSTNQRIHGKVVDGIFA